MSLTELAAWLRWGMEGVSEWHQNQTIAAHLLHRHPTLLLGPGLILHFLHGGLAGIVFAVVLSVLPASLFRLGTGLLFGIGLWILSLVIQEPLTGLGPWNHPLGLVPLLVSLVGHIIYGASLGFLVGWL